MIPNLSPEDIKALYPPDLTLQKVVLVHRHGQRTPVTKSFTNLLAPEIWHRCRLTPFLHSFMNLSHVYEKHGALPDFPVHERPPNFTRIAFETSSGKSLHETVTVKHMKRVVPGEECFYGQLTDDGKLTMKEMGSRLRRMYVDSLNFLPSFLDKSALEKISVRSTDYFRTIESVQYLLQGLYPPSLRSHEKELDLQIHVKDEEEETMFPHPKCASLRADFKDFREHAIKRDWDHFERIITKFRKYIDDGDINKNSIYRFYDFVAALRGHKIPYPHGITEDDVNEIESLVLDQWGNIFLKSESVTRKAIGRFLPEISSSLTNPDPKAPKLSIFSGHDSTILPLLAAFQAPDLKYPDFASIVSFELFKENMPSSQEQYVRLVHNGNPVNLPACAAPGKHRKGDPSLCTVSAFLSRVKQMTPVDYERECFSEVEVKQDWD